MLKYLLPLLLAGCASAGKTVLSMQAIDSAMSGTQAMDALERQPGVAEVSFDRQTAELTIQYDPQAVQPEALAKVARRATRARVIVGAGQGSYAETAGWPAGADVGSITSPDAPLTPVPGKITVFDFHANWCAPCRQVDAELRAMLAAGARIAVRKIDIGDWHSPLAQAHMQGIEELPYLRIYGPDGALIDSIVGLDLPRLRQRIESGGALRATP